MNHTTRIAVGLLLVGFCILGQAAPLGTAFTYQGELKQSGAPANGPFDFEIALFGAASGGAAIGTVTVNDAPVSQGLFTLELDYGLPPFAATQQYWLEVRMRPGTSTGAYTPLLPRQKLNAAPYALRALSVPPSAVTTTAWSLTGNAAAAGQFLGTSNATPLDLKANSQRILHLEANALSPNIIGGNPANSVSAGVRGATIAGGGLAMGVTDPIVGGGSPNRVTDVYGTVGGGAGNIAGADIATLGVGIFATVGGGAGNGASGAHSTVGGGVLNTASGAQSMVGGGFQNIASSIYSTVAGGSTNHASGADSTVSGGNTNNANGDHSAVGGGINNTAGGLASTVAGGFENQAAGAFSFAAGQHAVVNAVDAGTFVWADASSSLPFTSTGANRFEVRSLGGVRFVSAIDPLAGGGATAGVQLAAGGGSWSSISDRAVKTDVQSIDPDTILDALLRLPISRWRYLAQAQGIRHIGPMAQDFHAAFGVGEDEHYITGVDADGVALAAIQGLNRKLEAERDALKAENAALKAHLEALEAKIDMLFQAQR
ncbi:MAG: tail fiber domain-containing protein [Gammaproteobacteria bacterium]